MLRISRIVAASRGDHDAAGSLCRASAEVTAVAGASVMIVSDGVPAPLCASDSIAARLEELQITLGQGPCIDAFSGNRGVFEPDLARRFGVLWPAFAPEAVHAGAAAVFSYPLRLGGVRLGALTLYQPTAGDLSTDQHADARIMASVVTDAILSLQARADPGSLSPKLEALATDRAEVHQAAGMVSVQLGVDVREAMVRLRAHAYATDRPLVEVATDVVAGRLIFDE